MVFRQVGDDTDKLTTKFGLLNKSFINIKKDLSNGQGWRSFGNIVSQQDVANFSNFQQELKNGVSFHKAFNNNLLHSHTRIQQQAVDLRKLNSEQYLLNRQLRDGKITQQEYNAAMTANKAKIQALTTQTKTLTFAQKVASVTTKALGIALNTALNAGIMIAINAIIAGIMALVNSYQNSIDKIKEYSENIKSLEDNVKSLDSELKENLKKLRELEDIKAPSLYEQEQIDNLKETNKELERQIKLEKYKLKLQQIDIDKEAKDLWRRITFTDVSDADMFLPGSPKIAPSSWKLAQRDLDTYLKSYEDLQNFVKYYDAGKLPISPIEFEGISKEYEKRFKSYENKLMSFRNDMEIIMLGLDPDDPNNKYAIEQATKFVNIFDSIYSKVNDDSYGTFTSIYESAEFSGVVEELNTLAQVGKLTEETFNNVKGIEDFKAALAEIGITDTAEIIKAIGTAVGKTAKTTEKEGIPAVSNLVDKYTELADAIDKVISKQNKFAEIYKKIMTGGTFSREEMLGYLKEFPDLIDAVSMNEDGEFTFNLDKVKVELDKSNDDLTNQIQAQIDEATKGVNVSVEDFFKSDEGYNAAFSEASPGFRSNADVSAFKEKYFAEHKGEYDKYIQEQEENYNKLSNVLGLVDDNLISQAENLEILDERYNNAVDNITQYNSALDEIQGAINTVNAGQGLNYEQMTKLLAIDPSISNSITERNGLYYVEIQVLNDLKKARQEEQKETIRLEKKKTEVLIVQTQQRIEAIGREMAASFAKRDELWGEYTNQSQLLEGYKKILNGLDEYEYEPTQNSSSSGSGGVSDVLQQQIDRYGVLLNAIEIVSNRRIELLEAEKEALQDKNDEEQRELDLIEAKNNLDKVKKQKTIVYEKGKGFVQVENKKAISDAQKGYDDAVLEKRTAEIDKQIEGYENYAKQFTEMKSDIEDAITVEQAKKALKTDENGLLNLDEKTAKNIRDGLAGAVLEKDKQDNSGNPYYQNVTLDDLLKKLGATVNGEQATAIFADHLRNMQLPQTNMQAFNSNTTNNSYVNNTSSSNRNVSLNSTFNIYDASDPVKIRNEIDKYFRDIAREIK